jgi:aspartate aminotransferase-like enzyme
VVVTVLGKFSERWRVIAEAYQLKVVAVEAEWGDPVRPAQLEETLEQHPDASVVFTTHSETSTGVLQDIGAFASIAAGHGALLAVDAISSAAAHEIKTDEWGLDAVVGGAQKGTMVPPGLSFLSLSQKAITKMKAGRHSCYYFDLLSAVKKAEKGDTPYTPATPLVFALHKALKMIREEGLENVFERHQANADAVRAAVKAIGLELLASVPCNATTPVLIPGEKAGDVIRTMEERYGVKVAGGQLRLKGKIVRLGHLGNYNSTDMYTMISAFESTLNDLGIVDSFGAGVDALRRSYAGDKT